MTLETITEFAHSKLTASQRLYRYVSGDEFQRAYIRANANQRKKFKELVDVMDLTVIQRIAKRLVEDDLESLSFYELRELAKNYHVRFWHKLPKASLIFEIEARKKNVQHASQQYARNAGSDENPDSSLGDTGTALRENPSEDRTDQDSGGTD